MVTWKDDFNHDCVFTADDIYYLRTIDLNIYNNLITHPHTLTFTQVHGSATEWTQRETLLGGLGLGYEWEETRLAASSARITRLQVQQKNTSVRSVKSDERKKRHDVRGGRKLGPLYRPCEVCIQLGFIYLVWDDHSPRIIHSVTRCLVTSIQMTQMSSWGHIYVNDHPSPSPSLMNTTLCFWLASRALTTILSFCFHVRSRLSLSQQWLHLVCIVGVVF